MEKITLLLILVLLPGQVLTVAVNGFGAENLCVGIKDGDKGRDGAYYWRCKDGRVKAVGCEAGHDKIIQKRNKDNVDTEISMKCVPKGSVKCNFNSKIKVLMQRYPFLYSDCSFEPIFCDGSNGLKVTDGVYYWTCKDGKINAVFCEDNMLFNEMIIQPQHTKNINMGMSLKCVPKRSDVKCQFPEAPLLESGTGGCRLPFDTSEIYPVGYIINDENRNWQCVEHGFVAFATMTMAIPFEKKYCDNSDVCHYNKMWKLKPGKCGLLTTKNLAYVSSGENNTEIYHAETKEKFIIECIGDKQSDFAKEIRMRKVEDGESVRRCEENWSCAGTYSCHTPNYDVVLHTK